MKNRPHHNNLIISHVKPAADENVMTFARAFAGGVRAFAFDHHIHACLRPRARLLPFAVAFAHHIHAIAFAVAFGHTAGRRCLRPRARLPPFAVAFALHGASGGRGELCEDVSD